MLIYVPLAHILPQIPARVTFVCYNSAMTKRQGFTVLELTIVGAFAALLVIFFFIQKANIAAMSRDDQRKTAINAMYYALEEYYYPEFGYYPSTLSEDNLPVIDPELFTDPYGTNLGSDGCSYVYEPANCNDAGECQEFTLRATLEREDNYIKKGRAAS